MRRCISITICFYFLCIVTTAQEASTSLWAIPEKLIGKLQQKYQKMDDAITKKTNQYIDKLERQEKKLQKQLQTKDSVLAKKQLAAMQEHYQRLRNTINKPIQQPLKQYIPNLDSISVASKYLAQNSNTLTSSTNIEEIKALNTTVQSLQNKLQASVSIKKMMQQRKQQLQQQFEQFGVKKQLDNISKETYYYKQQIAEYKAMLKDKDKAQQKLLALLKENNSFKEFMKKNSFLAKFFPATKSAGGTSITGFQTREAVLNELQEKFGAAGTSNFIEQQVSTANNQLNALKAKANKLGASNSNAEMPDFKPNKQKTKSFLQRLEIGMNMQSVKSNHYLPSTSDIALSIGYKLNDRSTTGIGVAYKLGWGTGWNDIHLSNQGLGLRSFFDFKINQQSTAKIFRGLWVSGGYEWNYLPALQDKVYGINNLTANTWQQSGLIGISKKQKTGKKTLQVQILYNFLYKQNYPQTQPILFRIGWVK